MNRAMVGRLEKLEGANLRELPLLIVRFVIDAAGRAVECNAYRDGRGNVWRREPGESLEAFEDRAGAAAIEAAPIGCAAALIPCDDGGWQ